MEKRFFVLVSVLALSVLVGTASLLAGADDSSYYQQYPKSGQYSTTAAATTTSTCVNLTAAEIQCLTKMQTVVTNANPYDVYSWGGARGTLEDLSKNYAPCRTLRQKCSQLEPQDIDQAKSPVKYKAHFLAEASKIEASVPKAKAPTALATDASDKTLELLKLTEDNCILFKGQLTAGQTSLDMEHFYAHCRADMNKYLKVAKIKVYDCGASTTLVEGSATTLQAISAPPTQCTKVENLDYLASCALRPRYSATASCDYECYMPTASLTVTKRLYYTCDCLKTSSKKLADLYHVIKWCTPTAFYN